MTAVVFRSTRYADCEQCAFLLYAVGVAAEIVPDEREFVLVVAEEQRERALEELRRHESEARAWTQAQRAPALILHPQAWVGVAGYTVVLLAVAYCAGEGVFGVDWRGVGALLPTLQAREGHRLITALTLHGDVAHLAANLLLGGVFGYFAGQLLGPGVAWFAVLIAAVCGNWLDTLVMPAINTSIGASTAVFATLGLVAVHAWRRDTQTRMRWAYRFAPLVAAIALLAFTGAGGERTDVIAHITGFLSGAALGAVPTLHRLHGAGAQWLSGVATLAAIVAAWWSALSAAPNLN